MPLARRSALLAAAVLALLPAVAQADATVDFEAFTPGATELSIGLSLKAFKKTTTMAVLVPRS
ncbi:MAG: hypothetical protein QOE06_3395 [Thermoleophilaceae bacterium]|nr:hypothetical protein [Thermoleophilaceae bacterium]